MNKTKRNIFSVISVLSIGIMGFVVWHFFKQTTPEDVMKMMVKDNKDAVISIGIWQDGKEDMYIYTNDGKKDFAKYRYQIG